VEIAATNYLAAKQTSTKREAIIDSYSRLSEIARERYEAGTGTQLDVLNAKRDWGDANMNFVKADAQRIVSLISLYKALGGGWETFAPLRCAEISAK